MADGDLTREWAKLQSLLSRAEEVADRIAPMLGERTIRPIAPLPTTPEPTTDATLRLADPVWELRARPGVGQLRIGGVTDGLVAVSIDEAKEFSLTPALAHLLAVLAEGDTCDTDGFPPFRSIRELAAVFSARTGRPAGERAVVVGISRLRRRLWATRQLSPKLVETMSGRGARFRIHRNRKAPTS